MLPLFPLFSSLFLVFSLFLGLWFPTQSPSPLHTLLKHLSYLYFKVPLKKSFGERIGESWLIGMILPATGSKYEEVVRFTWWTTQLERSGCEQAEAAKLTTCLLSLSSLIISLSFPLNLLVTFTSLHPFKLHPLLSQFVSFLNKSSCPSFLWLRPFIFLLFLFFLLLSSVLIFFLQESTSIRRNSVG